MNSLEANIRNNSSKGQLNKIRISGNVPAIVYGGKEQNQKISISKKLLKSLIEKENFLSTVISLNVDGKQQNVLPKEIKYQGPITQKEFLINLGIKSRFENLAKNKSAIERRHLFTQFERLVSPSHMGQAFKVMILYSENMKSFEGFK